MAKAILLSFENALKIRNDFYKSIIVLFNIEQGVSRFETLMNYKKVSFPVTYLGLPAIDRKLSKQCWMLMIKNKDTTLASWKGGYFVWVVDSH